MPKMSEVTKKILTRLLPVYEGDGEDFFEVIKIDLSSKDNTDENIQDFFLLLPMICVPYWEMASTSDKMSMINGFLHSFEDEEGEKMNLEASRIEVLSDEDRQVYYLSRRSETSDAADTEFVVYIRPELKEGESIGKRWFAFGLALDNEKTEDELFEEFHSLIGVVADNQIEDSYESTPHAEMGLTRMCMELGELIYIVSAIYQDDEPTSKAEIANWQTEMLESLYNQYENNYQTYEKNPKQYH